MQIAPRVTRCLIKVKTVWRLVKIGSCQNWTISKFKETLFFNSGVSVKHIVRHKFTHKTTLFIHKQSYAIYTCYSFSLYVYMFYTMYIKTPLHYSKFSLWKTEKHTGIAKRYDYLTQGCYTFKLTWTKCMAMKYFRIVQLPDWACVLSS